MENPVIIEVALNGATPTSRNPHVPQTQEALVADALRCIAAGASVVHTHATYATAAASCSNRPEICGKRCP